MDNELPEGRHILNAYRLRGWLMWQDGLKKEPVGCES